MLCMVELGELENRHEDFTRRNTRILAVSLETPEVVAQTQAKFPHLKLVADGEGRLIDTVAVRHLRAAPDRGDAAAPTTILVDRTGTVRWVFRPDRYLTRLAPDELLAAVDQHLPNADGHITQ